MREGRGRERGRRNNRVLLRGGLQGGGRTGGGREGGGEGREEEERRGRLGLAEVLGRWHGRERGRGG
jgi:hypothetical protein